jgi:ATP-binding cassette subfamily B protein
VHTAAQCLAAVARHHGLQASPERLIHEFALGEAEPPTATVLAMARSIGLKARATTLDWNGLAKLEGVFPLVARLDNGNWVILSGVRRDPQSPAVLVVDPLGEGGKALVLERERFERSWRGEVLLLKRVYSLLDPQQPFGLAWFLPEMLREKEAFRSVVVAALALHLIALLVPIYFQLVIDKVLVHQSFSTLWVLTTGIVFALMFEAAFSFLRQYLLLRATNKIDLRLARRIFAHLLALPIDFFEAVPAGVLVRHMQQVEKIRQFLTGRLLLTALDASALVLFLPLLFLYSPRLAAVVLFFTALVMGVVVALIGPFRRRLRALYEAEGQRQSMLVESIHGMRTVKALTIEPVQRKYWDQRAAQSVNMHFRVGLVSVSAQALTGFLEKLMMVAVIAIGAHDVFSGTLTVGALIAFQMISQRVVGPLVQIVSLVHEYQETAISVKMLGEIMNRPVERAGTVGGLQPRLAGEIRFEGVSFRYASSAQPVLANLTLTIPAGKVFGVVGRSGSGKTTFTRLIQGLYPVEEGILRFDGVDQREIDLAWMRRQIGVVLQENFLFRGTIRDNILASRPDAGMEAVVQASRAAGAEEFIERLPRGYDTLLEENAENLSGGQRQRLAIARALIARPAILILDEAASALDPESEAIFLANLARIAADKTVIIVSHRLSTLVRADAIMVMERGAVLDIGRHSELLGRCAAYASLWRQQAAHLEKAT